MSSVKTKHFKNSIFFNHQKPIKVSLNKEKFYEQMLAIILCPILTLGANAID